MTLSVSVGFEFSERVKSFRSLFVLSVDFQMVCSRLGLYID